MKTIRAFTLIELMVVISIISLLASVVLVSIRPSIVRARDSRRVSDIHQIDLAIQQYIADNGHPPYLDGCATQTPLTSGTLSSCLAVSTQSLNGYPENPTTGWGKLAKQLSPYLKTMPTDPCNGSCTATNGMPLAYTYIAPAALEFLAPDSDSNYQLSAELENGDSAGGSTGEPVSYDTLIAPSVPENLEATIGAGMLDYRYGMTYNLYLTWDASIVGSGGTSIAGYITEITGGLNSDLITGLSDWRNSRETTVFAGPWCWRVVAIDNNGHKSAESSSKCVSI